MALYNITIEYVKFRRHYPCMHKIECVIDTGGTPEEIEADKTMLIKDMQVFLVERGIEATAYIQAVLQYFVEYRMENRVHRKEIVRVKQDTGDILTISIRRER